MGVDYEIEKYKNYPLKLSLLLHKSGISTCRDIVQYLDWAKSYAQKVVIRQLFEPTDEKYREYYLKEFVGTEIISRGLGLKELEYDGINKIYEFCMPMAKKERGGK